MVRERDLRLRDRIVGQREDPAGPQRRRTVDSRLALVRDDRGAVVIDANLSALGPFVTILGGMEKGEALVGPDYRDRPDFWRVT